MTTLSFTRTIVEGEDKKGYLRFSISESDLPSALKPHEVLIQIEAAPINPSDIGPLFMPSYGGIGRFAGVKTGRDASGRPTTSLPLPDREPSNSTILPRYSQFSSLRYALFLG